MQAVHYPGHTTSHHSQSTSSQQSHPQSNGTTSHRPDDNIPSTDDQSNGIMLPHGHHPAHYGPGSQPPLPPNTRYPTTTLPLVHAGMPNIAPNVGPLLPPPSGMIRTPLPPASIMQPQMYHAAPALIPPRLPQPPPGPLPLSYSAVRGQYKYSLVVEQQPVRARMCGFGDKDRRPITPPPCVRLVIQDARSGQPLDFTEIDGGFFVLQVDLWSAEADREVNIVKGNSSSPAVSISTATTTSFPPPPERPLMDTYGNALAVYYGPDGEQVLSAVPPVGYYAAAVQTGPAYPGYPPPGLGYLGGQPTVGYVQSLATNMFTRNLIGSLTVNASRLTDPDGKVDFWFVLQDLSIRTEGWFRLKMNFIDVGVSMSVRNNGGLNRGRAPVLAWVFSDKFQVFSAKKFPGVIESTSLSKCFASQGIKIPIRKDGPKGEAAKDENEKDSIATDKDDDEDDEENDNEGHDNIDDEDYVEVEDQDDYSDDDVDGIELWEGEHIALF